MWKEIFNEVGGSDGCVCTDRSVSLCGKAELGFISAQNISKGLIQMPRSLNLEEEYAVGRNFNLENIVCKILKY